MTAISSSTVLDCVALGAVSKLAAQPVLAAKALYMAQFVCAVTASGFMTDPDFATTGCVLGVAASDSAAVAGESSGDRGVDLLCGLFWRPNFATRPVVLTDIGKVCYATDNYTVGNTSTDGPVAGIVCGLDATMGVLVLVEPGLNYLLSQATLSANLASIVAGLGGNLIGYDDSGNKTLAATLSDAIDEIYVALKSAQGRVELNLGGATKADGTPLAKYSAANDGTCGIYGDGTTGIGIRWNNTAGATDTIAVPDIMVPPDADLTAAMYVKIKASKVGATIGDATTFVVGAYAHTKGAAFDGGANLGATSGAMTGDATTKFVQLVSATITAPASAAQSIGVTINPTAAKLGTDDVIVWSAWLQYTKKLAAS